MNFRIISLGKDFDGSNRRSMLCQQITKDDFGFETLGSQFHWEIRKDTWTPEIQEKLQAIVDAKTVVERPFKLQTAVRSNPNTGEVTEKLIATM